jgi:hypothetical protein
MEFWSWLGQNWFSFLQSVGIIGGLVFTAASLRINGKARRTSNLLAITKQHRDIWRELWNRPELSRLLKPTVDFERKPITLEEELFVKFVILHLGSAHHASEQAMLIPPEQLRQDVRWFFSLAIPKAI